MNYLQTALGLLIMLIIGYYPAKLIFKVNKMDWSFRVYFVSSMIAVIYAAIIAK